MSHLKNAQELVGWAASKIGCGYLFGDNGLPITEELIQAKARQYPGLYTSSYIRRCRKWIGNKDEQGNLLPGFDCSGLIDVFLGVDLNAKGYYANADTKGKMGSFPATVPGVLVFKAGWDGIIDHVGISDGKGSVIEAKGVDFGVVKTDLTGSGWDFWAYCHLLDYAPVLGPTPNVVPGIRFGERGPRVKWLQTALNLKGYGLKADGIFGPATNAAVRHFQGKNGLKVDGICGPKTADKLTE